MDIADSSRLALAKGLREQADGSSEAALRSALSRSYYSIFHAATVLDRKIRHHNIASKLESIEKGLGEKAVALYELRQDADYDPGFIDKRYGGIFEAFKEDARHQVNEGLKVFNRILREIDDRAGSGKE
jgi:uncharacterized protein (UPF0332 family)